MCRCQQHHWQLMYDVMKALENLLKESLGTATLKLHGNSGGGSINQGRGYLTDQGPVFVKTNAKPEAKRMFDGEFASLQALFATKTIRVPKPILSLENPAGGALLVTEYLEMTGKRSFSREFGQQLARLHLHNSEQHKIAVQQASHIKSATSEEDCVLKFGFQTVTCCGYLPQVNDWCDDWIEFFVRNRLGVQVEMAIERYGDRELKELWPQLEHAVPSLFDKVEIFPALLHGDLWSGNFSETSSEPVVFDPASFYGHSEYEFGIAKMFGGFDRAFFDAYHQLIPKSPGFDRRVDLYQLFHHLNHWNHFGGGYRSSSIELIKTLLNSSKNVR